MIFFFLSFFLSFFFAFFVSYIFVFFLFRLHCPVPVANPAYTSVSSLCRQPRPLSRPRPFSRAVGHGRGET